MLNLGPSSPADVAMGQLANLAATAGVTAGQVIRAVRNTLDAWQGQRDGRQHAMHLRTLLAADLAGAIERADRMKLAERQQAQAAVEALRVAIMALGDRLDRW